MFLLILSLITYDVDRYNPDFTCPQYPGVILGDIYRFTNNYGQVKSNYSLCKDNHYYNNKSLNETIKYIYNISSYIEWKGDLDYRWEVWNTIDNLTYPKQSWDIIKQLYNLKSILGDENYYTGTLPFPIPNYKYSNKE